MTTDFSQGKVWRNIVAQAIPLILAQLVQLLYNVVDRIYIGHLPGENNIALTGVGLVFPVITLIMAFTSLIGMGGATMFAIARGAKEEEKAEKIMGNAVSLLIIFSAVLMVVCYVFQKPILYLFGASDASYVYAAEYLQIYLLGTVFSMLTSGLNGFINSQGFPKVGMMTTVIGAILNLVLDPVFIFGFDMGVRGAALATVISQVVAAIWVLRFLTGKKAILHIKSCNLFLEGALAKEMVTLGMPGFIMQGTNCLVQVTCNATLQTWGGDVYVGIMTILNSVREILSLPVFGISNGAQPVLGYNYGAGNMGRVKEGIRFTAIIGISYTVVAWILVMILLETLISIFSGDKSILVQGKEGKFFYVYDIQRKIWHTQNAPENSLFLTSADNKIYLAAGSQIICLSGDETDNEYEKSVSWSFRIRFDDSQIQKLGFGQLSIKYSLGKDAFFTVRAIYDDNTRGAVNGAKYDEASSYGYKINMPVRRCNWFELEFCGMGNFKLKSMNIKFYRGSEI